MKIVLLLTALLAAALAQTCNNPVSFDDGYTADYELYTPGSQVKSWTKNGACPTMSALALYQVMGISSPAVARF